MRTPIQKNYKDQKYSKINLVLELLKKAKVVEKYRRHKDREYQKGNEDNHLNKNWENIKLAI